MNCTSPKLMDLYLEGELDEKDRRNFEVHLEGCAECRAALAERRVLLGAFRSLMDIEVPPEFAGMVMDRLPAPSRFAFGWVAALLVGVCAALAALLGTNLVSGESLANVLVSLNRSLLGIASLVLPYLAKAAKLIGLAAKLVYSLAVALMKGLGILSSFIRPEVLGLFLAAGIFLSFLFVLGVKRILSVGEKP